MGATGFEPLGTFYVPDYEDITEVVPFQLPHPISSKILATTDI
jgi:hypothetical protein